MKITLEMNSHNEMGKVVLTNASGDTYTTSSEELNDFLDGAEKKDFVPDGRSKSIREFLTSKHIYAGFKATYNYDAFIEAMDEFSSQECQAALSAQEEFENGFIEWLFDTGYKKRQNSMWSFYLGNDTFSLEDLRKEYTEKYFKLMFMEKNGLGEQDMINDNKPEEEL